MDEQRSNETVEDIEDVEGHRRRAPVLGVESEDDVEGHRRRAPVLGAESEDDVAGHVQPPRDLDIER